MRRDQVCTDQWVYNLLVNGFPGPDGAHGRDPLWSHRTRRLKNMVLHSIFHDFDGLKSRQMSVDGTPRV